MTLPIRWAVVRELSTDSPAIMARLVHNGTEYKAANVLPRNWTREQVIIGLAAMTADFENTVKTPPAN